MKGAAMLVVSHRGVNFGLGCSEQNAMKFSPQSLVYRVAHEEI